MDNEKKSKICLSLIGIVAIIWISFFTFNFIEQTSPAMIVNGVKFKIPISFEKLDSSNSLSRIVYGYSGFMANTTKTGVESYQYMFKSGNKFVTISSRFIEKDEFLYLLSEIII